MSIFQSKIVSYHEIKLTLVPSPQTFYTSYANDIKNKLHIICVVYYNKLHKF